MKVESKSTNLSDIDFQKLNIWNLIRNVDQKDKQDIPVLPTSELDDSNKFKPSSQNTRNNTVVLNGFVNHLKNSSYLNTFHLVDMKLTNKMWSSIGVGISKNKSLKVVKIALCNLNDTSNIEAFMDGFKLNETV